MLFAGFWGWAESEPSASLMHWALHPHHSEASSYTPPNYTTMSPVISGSLRLRSSKITQRWDRLRGHVKTFRVLVVPLASIQSSVARQ